MMRINKAIENTAQDAHSNHCVLQFVRLMQQQPIDAHTAAILFLKSHESIYNHLHDQLATEIDIADILQVYAKIAQQHQVCIFAANQDHAQHKAQSKVIGELLAAAEFFYAMVYGIHEDDLDQNHFFSKISKTNGLVYIDRACRKMMDTKLTDNELTNIHRMIICKANNTSKENHMRPALDACFYFSALANGMKKDDIENEKTALILTRFKQFLAHEDKHKQYNQLLRIVERFYPEKLLGIIIEYSKIEQMSEQFYSELQLSIARMTQQSSHRLVIKEQLCRPWLDSKSSKSKSIQVESINSQCQHINQLLNNPHIKINNLYSQLTILHQICDTYIQQKAPELLDPNKRSATTKPQPNNLLKKQKSSRWSMIKGIFKELIKHYKNNNKAVPQHEKLAQPIQDIMDLKNRSDFIRHAILIDIGHDRHHRITRK